MYSNSNSILVNFLSGSPETSLFWGQGLYCNGLADTQLQILSDFQSLVRIVLTFCSGFLQLILKVY